MHEEIRIKGDQGEIKIQILGRENPRARDTDDFDWLRARLLIDASGFSGEINLGLWWGELMTLRTQLEAALTNIRDGVSFHSMEGNWIFELAFQTTGAAVITGRVVPDPSRANALHYEFRSDPISLEETSRDLRHLTETYREVAQSSTGVRKTR